MSVALNPILARELKERMRSLRAPVVLTGYLILLGLIVLMAERYIARESQFGNPFAEATAGRTVFHYLLFFLLLFVCLMVPAFTASAISSERERQTLHLVQVTRLSPRRIVNGKLSAAMAYLILLVVATLPLLSVGFILGGVTPLDVLRGYGMVLLTGFTIGMISIAISSSMRRTLGATVVAFLLMLVLLVGTWLGFGLVTFFQNRDFPERPPPRPIWTVVLNPFVGTASAIQGRDTGGRSPTPFEGLFSFLSEEIFFAERAVQLNGEFVVQQDPRRDGRAVPVWVWTVIGYLVIGGGAYALAVRGVTTPRPHLITGGRRRRNVVAET